MGFQEDLLACNRTELATLAWRMRSVSLPPTVPKQTMIDIIAQGAEPGPECYDPVDAIRTKMYAIITKYRKELKLQIAYVCKGACFDSREHCPDTKAMSCYLANRHLPV